MTRQNIQELRKGSDEAIRALIQEQRAKLLELSVKKQVSGIKNVRELRELKKGIARMLTILGERNK